MGVNIPDAKAMVERKLAEHLTTAALWQRIGRAGRDQSLSAVPVVFAEERHILTTNTEGSCQTRLRLWRPPSGTRA